MSAKTASREPKASGEDSFIAETLSTDRALRACLSLRPKEAKNDDWAYWEVKSFMELGDGVNGHPKIAHGGFLAVLLDEVCGILAMMNAEARLERMRTSKDPNDTPPLNYFTACAYERYYTTQLT